ncbi:MAG: hypothetical protein KL801_15570 [Mesorhizobium sp.]|nr:hypothetical protein [Mesorhizobium sp.]
MDFNNHSAVYYAENLPANATMDSSLFNFLETKEGVKRVRVVIEQWIIENKIKLKSKHIKWRNIDHNSEAICQAYWLSYIEYSKIAPHNINDKVDAASRAASLLIESIDTGVRILLVEKVFKPLALAESEEARNPRRQQELLENFLSTLERIRNLEAHVEPKRGARPKKHNQLGVQGCADMWISLTGMQVPKTFEMAKGHHGTSEFVSPAVQFVAELMQAIDPRVTLSEVRSALKSSTVKTRRHPK